LIQELRKLISVGEKPPINILFEEGTIEILLRLLEDIHLSDKVIIREVLWLFINIIAGSDYQQINFLKNSSLTDKLLQVIQINDPEIIENVIF